MTGAELSALLTAALERLEDSRDELRRLDAALGDGDLGITVSKGAAAARAKLAELGVDADPVGVLRAVAPAIATANPSTYAALTAAGLLAGAKALDDAQAIDRAQALALGRAAADTIAKRGKSAVGDKTVLDALVPSLEALASAPAGALAALEAMIAAARGGVEETAGLRSQKGRASWVGDRSEGQPDPGATAYLRFLEALREVFPR